MSASAPIPGTETCCAAAIAERPDGVDLSHRQILLALAAAGLTVFAVWQVTGIEHYLTSLGGYCL
jgi:hypothetical protein